MSQRVDRPTANYTMGVGTGEDEYTPISDAVLHRTNTHAQR